MGKRKDGFAAAEAVPYGFEKNLKRGAGVFNMCRDMAMGTLRGMVCWALWDAYKANPDKSFLENQQIVASTGISHSEVSIILAYLEKNSVIDRKRKGKTKRNQLSDSALVMLRAMQD